MHAVKLYHSTLYTDTVEGDNIDCILRELEKSQEHMQMASKILDDYTTFCKRVSYDSIQFIILTATYFSSMFPHHPPPPPLTLCLVLPLSTHDQRQPSYPEWWVSGREILLDFEPTLYIYVHRMLPPKGLLGVLQTVSSLTDAVDRQSPVIPQGTPRPMPFTWTMALKRVNLDIL